MGQDAFSTLRTYRPAISWVDGPIVKYNKSTMSVRARPGWVDRSNEPPHGDTVGSVKARVAFEFAVASDADAQILAKGLKYPLAESTYESKEALKRTKLYKIVAELRSSGYALVKEALIAKFGDPARIEKKTFSNKLGASFEGELATWSLPNGIISFSELSEDINISLLIYYDPALSPAVASRNSLDL